MARGVNTEITLDPGRYLVLMKVTASRNERKPTEEAVRQFAMTRRQKLFQLGLQYDLAHSKGLTGEKEREWHEQNRRQNERRRKREEIKVRMQTQWIRQRKRAARNRRQGDFLAGRQPPAGMGVGERDQKVPPGTSNGKNEREVMFETSLTNAMDNGTRKRRLTVETDVHYYAAKATKLVHEGKVPRLETRLATNHLAPEDLENLEGFEFDSDVDMPPEEEESSSRESHLLERGMRDNDPWNAVCIVGLRVYSKDPDLSLQVVHTDENADGLDMDDPAASATTATNEFSAFRRDL